MNAQVRKDTPSPYVAATSPEEARKLAEELMEVMSTLLNVVDARPSSSVPGNCARP